MCSSAYNYGKHGRFQYSTTPVFKVDSDVINRRGSSTKRLRFARCSIGEKTIRFLCRPHGLPVDNNVRRSRFRPFCGLPIARRPNTRRPLVYYTALWSQEFSWARRDCGRPVAEITIVKRAAVRRFATEIARVSSRAAGRLIPVYTRVCCQRVNDTDTTVFRRNHY